MIPHDLKRFRAPRLVPALLFVIAAYLLLSTLDYRWNVEPKVSPAAQVIVQTAIPAAPASAGLSMPCQWIKQDFGGPAVPPTCVNADLTERAK